MINPEHLRRDLLLKEMPQPSSIPIIMLAGGKGERIEAVTKGEIPKLLVRSEDGSTLLDLNIDIFRKAGAENIILAVAHQKEQIISHLKHSSVQPWVRISDQGEPNGIIDAVSKALVQFRVNSDFIACDGDGIRFGFDLNYLLEEHTCHRSLATLALASVNDPSKHYGVHLNTEGQVLSFQKFPFPADGTPTPVHTGLVLFSKETRPLFDKPRTDGGWDSMYDDLLATGRLYGVIMGTVSYFNINNQKALAEMNSWLKGEGKLN